jgi:hypothetical protein
MSYEDLTLSKKITLLDKIKAQPQNTCVHEL